jgi:hypothetical protein
VVNVAGAIDGSDIPIVPPPWSGDAYINSKGFSSIKLQAVCGNDTRFMDAFFGASGGWHDQVAFSQSDLWSPLHEGWLGTVLRSNGIDLPLPPAAPSGAECVVRVPSSC